MCVFYRTERKNAAIKLTATITYIDVVVSQMCTMCKCMQWIDVVLMIWCWWYLLLGVTSISYHTKLKFIHDEINVWHFLPFSCSKLKLNQHNRALIAIWLFKYCFWCNVVHRFLICLFCLIPASSLYIIE